MPSFKVLFKGVEMISNHWKVVCIASQLKYLLLQKQCLLWFFYPLCIIAARIGRLFSNLTRRTRHFVCFDASTTGFRFSLLVRDFQKKRNLFFYKFVADAKRCSLIPNNPGFVYFFHKKKTVYYKVTGILAVT